MKNTYYGLDDLRNRQGTDDLAKPHRWDEKEARLKEMPWVEYVEICPCFSFILGTEVLGNYVAAKRSMFLEKKMFRLVLFPPRLLRSLRKAILICL